MAIKKKCILRMLVIDLNCIIVIVIVSTHQCSFNIAFHYRFDTAAIWNEF
jgi:hypothetical protein